MKNWMKWSWRDTAFLTIGIILGACFAYGRLYFFYSDSEQLQKVDLWLYRGEIWISNNVTMATVGSIATIFACIFAFMSANIASKQYTWSRIETEISALEILLSKLDAIKNCIDTGFSRDFIEDNYNICNGPIPLREVIEEVKNRVVKIHTAKIKEIPYQYINYLPKTNTTAKIVEYFKDGKMNNEKVDNFYQAGDTRIDCIFEDLKIKTWDPFKKTYSKYYERRERLLQRREVFLFRKHD